MRTVLVLATLVALAVAGSVPSFPSPSTLKTRSVEPVTVERQYKVLKFFEGITQNIKFAEYYKVGKEYDIKAHPEFYVKHGVVEKFFKIYEKGFLPPHYPFSIFEKNSRHEALALYDLFYYAKDFDTFYKTAAWARVHLNEGLFAYSFYLAIVHRADTKDLVVPAFYEIYPKFYVNQHEIEKMSYGKMHGMPFEEVPEYDIYEQDGHYYYYSNYSDYYTYGKQDHKISYFTEDIGWNSYYTYFHSVAPFWMKGDDIAHGLFKERRGEYYYFFYQRLLARYYLERLSNGLGEIPKFSWYQPFYNGYRPFLTSTFYPFAHRPEHYFLQTEKNLEDLRFVRNYEDMFLSYLEQGQFHAYNQDVDFYNASSINFVSNFWQTNPDLYENYGKSHSHHSYEMTARRILGGAAYSHGYKKYEFLPTALDFYQTSLRDPAFYQIYNKIIYFIMQYKKYYTQPYSYEKLHFVGAKVRDVEFSKLETYFEFYPFNVTSAIYQTDKDLTSAEPKSYVVVQPRLNHEPFNVKIHVKSDYEGPATFKIFLGPKYDSYGKVIPLEDNWMNFVELDWFTQKIGKGDVTIERTSDQFFHFKEDSFHISGLYELLNQGKLPVDMMEKYDRVPKRLMLPRGSEHGFPFQFFVVVYPATELPKELESLRPWIVDDLPFGYPFDRPVAYNFFQPNMYMKDVFIYHKGSKYPTTVNVEHYQQTSHH